MVPIDLQRLLLALVNFKLRGEGSVADVELAGESLFARVFAG